MLHAALQSTDPVILFEYTSYWIWKRNSEEATPVTITEAKVRREGKISIITYGAAVYKCLEAANELAKIGIEAEVVDLRVRPGRSHFLGFRLKHRAIIVEEAWRSVSISAEVSARIMEKCFMTWTSCTTIMWCGSPDPYANHLEEATSGKWYYKYSKKIIHHDWI
jgi:pyruvate dehydrogenase E1 component beta subunit